MHDLENDCTFEPEFLNELIHSPKFVFQVIDLMMKKFLEIFRKNLNLFDFKEYKETSYTKVLIFFVLLPLLLHITRDWTAELLRESILGSIYGFIEIPSYELDIFVIVITVLLFAKFIHLGTTGYHLPNKFFLFLMYIFAYYILIKYDAVKICDSTYEFIGFKLFDKVGYIAFLLISLIIGYIIYFVLFIRWKIVSDYLARTNTQNPVILGFPIDNDDDDNFNHKTIADKVTDFIMRSKSGKGAFSIGINGKWGTGKSSILNLVKVRLDDKLKNKESDHLLITFSAMLINENNSITVEFLNLLSSELKKVNWGSSSEIKKYIFYLTGKVNDLMSGIISVFWGDRSSQDQLQRLKTELKKINRQVVVFIDDLDRAQTDEIIQILRLIKNIADLPNLVYVIAFDKDYLIKSLGKENSTESYLEKFFNVEITVPVNDNTVIRNESLKVINEHIPEIGSVMSAVFGGNVKKNNEAEMYGIFSIADFFDNCIKTRRDLSKFINALIAVPEKLFSEILIEKLIIVELIKLKYSKLYTELQDKSIITKNENGFYIYDLEKLKTTLQNNQYINTDFLINRALDVLFDSNAAGIANRNLLSISNPDRYNLYFNYFYTDFLPYAELEFLREE